MFKRSLILMLVVSLMGCKGGYLTQYTFHTKVERIFYGPNEQRKSFSKEMEGTSFEDAMVRIHYSIDDYGISVSMKNKSRESIWVLWDEATYIDSSGRSQSIILLGRCDVSTKDLSAKPIRVSPGRIRKFYIFPSGCFHWQEEYKEWEKYRTLFVPPGYRVGHTPEEIVNIAAENKGKSIKIILPMEVDGERYEYHFTFTIERVGSRVYRDIF